MTKASTPRLRKYSKRPNAPVSRYPMRRVHLLTPVQANDINLLSFVPEFMEGRGASEASVVRAAINLLVYELKPIVSALRELDPDMPREQFEREAFVIALRYRPLLARITEGVSHE